MNRAQLIDEMAKKTGSSKKDMDRALSAMLDTITGALAEGEKVQLVGFGCFETRRKSARTIKNPFTGNVDKVPESVTTVFKPGKLLKNNVNEKAEDAMCIGIS